MTWGNILGTAGAALLSLILSLVCVAFLLVQLPATYFLDSHCRQLWIDQHPIIRSTGVILKNLLGIFLILLGGVLSIPFVPGQGLLTVMVGLLLLDFPGKRPLERSLLRRPLLRRLVDRLRKRYGKPPFELP